MAFQAESALEEYQALAGAHQAPLLKKHLIPAGNHDTLGGRDQSHNVRSEDGVSLAQPGAHPPHQSVVGRGRYLKPGSSEAHAQCSTQAPAPTRAAGVLPAPYPLDVAHTGQQTEMDSEAAQGRAAVAKLESSLAVSAEDLAASQCDLATAHGKLATVQKDLDVAQGDLATARRDLAAAQGDLTTVWKDLDTARSDLAMARKDLDATQSDLAAVQGELAASISKSSAMEQARHCSVSGLCVCVCVCVCLVCVLCTRACLGLSSAC